MRRGTIAAVATGGALVALGLGVAACMQGPAEKPLASVGASPNSGFGLFYTDEGGSAKLAYGQANSDNVLLMFECTKGSRMVEMVDAAQTNGAPGLTLASNGKTETLKTRTEDGEGGALLVAHTAYDAAPLSAFRHSGRLEVARGAAHVDLNATADERVGLERFFTACGG